MNNGEAETIAFLKTLGFEYNVKQDVYTKEVKVYNKFLGLIPYSSFKYQILADIRHGSLILMCEDTVKTYLVTPLMSEKYDEIKDEVTRMARYLKENHRTIIVRSVSISNADLSVK